MPSNSVGPNPRSVAPAGTTRLAGALYLLSDIAAGVRLIYVPGNLIIEGDAAATATKILAAEPLFRACLAGEITGAILLLFLVRQKSLAKPTAAMFLLRSEKGHAGSIAVSTVSPSSISEGSAQRTARHIVMLQRLTELSMKLATRAAEDALRYPPTHKAGQNARTDPRLLFARLSRCVRETIALKARIAAGQSPAAAGEQAETYSDSRHFAILVWLQSEIAASHHRDPNDHHNGKFALHGPNPN